mmetsp:Transcript_34042/g.63562  ORF Transcript_34042/g.63562 Transcript_34042/m.63562 type:complete len:97 (+) Transcript_34042:32-322(+)
MENLPGRIILEKLEQGGWEWDDLPIRDDATSWSDVETGCGLTKQELSRVKNVRCPAQAGVSSRGQGQDSLSLNELVLEESHIVKTNVAGIKSLPRG